MAKDSDKPKKDFKKKEAILDLSKYQDSKVIVKYQGGRQVVGTLRGFDLMQNLVLDDAFEYLRGIQRSEGYLLFCLSEIGSSYLAKLTRSLKPTKLTRSFKYANI